MSEPIAKATPRSRLVSLWGHSSQCCPRKFPYISLRSKKVLTSISPSHTSWLLDDVSGPVPYSHHQDKLSHSQYLFGSGQSKLGRQGRQGRQVSKSVHHPSRELPLGKTQGSHKFATLLYHMYSTHTCSGVALKRVLQPLDTTGSGMTNDRGAGRSVSGCSWYGSALSVLQGVVQYSTQYLSE